MSLEKDKLLDNGINNERSMIVSKGNKKLVTDEDITAALIIEYKTKNLPLEDLFYKDGIQKREPLFAKRTLPSDNMLDPEYLEKKLIEKTNKEKIVNDEAKQIQIESKTFENIQKEIAKKDSLNIQNTKPQDASQPPVITRPNPFVRQPLNNINQTPPITNIQNIENIKNNDLKNDDVNQSQEKEINTKNINSTEAKQIDANKPVKTYVRLKDQNKDDLINLNIVSEAKIKPGICSYDPNAKYAIEMIDIYKSFNNGRIKANKGITIRVKKNEVHAIIGENGAGKSVLMSILFGIYEADSGEIKVNGQSVMYSSAMDATYDGLGMVHQHFKLVETYTAYQNIILGCENVNKWGIVEHKQAKQRLKNIIEKYNLKLDINKKVSKLNVADQQKIEIIKLLYRDVDILIFDEPTASLSDLEIKNFLEIIKRLKQEGKTIILITHKFNEIKEVADRGSVIRLGTFICDFDIKDYTSEQMATLMVGNEIATTINKEKGKIGDKVVLSVKDLIINNGIKGNPISFDVREGEIFAIAGVTGNGQSELALMLSGLQKPKHGSIKLCDKKITTKSIKKRYDYGLSFVPEDRHKHAIILDMPIYLNTALNRIDSKQFSKNGIINDASIRENARILIKKYDVRGTTRGLTNVRLLSGGNQQKLVLGREIENDHKLLILVQPTRGLDLSAINNIHKLILEEKAKNKAILLISYELDEIMSIADTVAIMSKSSFVKVSNINNITRDEIGKIMSGKEE